MRDVFKVGLRFFFIISYFLCIIKKNEKAGFGQLLNPLKLFDSHFHSMQVHVIPVCVNSVKIKIKGVLKMGSHHDGEKKKWRGAGGGGRQKKN